MVVSVGFLSGCIGNDDEKFLNKAGIIVNDLYPVTTTNLYSKYSKAEEYKLALSDYTLSPECEHIRENIEQGIDYIDWAYEETTKSYFSSYALMETWIEIANNRLKMARDDIRELQD